LKSPELPDAAAHFGVGGIGIELVVGIGKVGRVGAEVEVGGTGAGGPAGTSGAPIMKSA
jgi:hypothetical protein